MAVSRYTCANEKINVIHLNCLAFCSCGSSSSSYGSLFQTVKMAKICHLYNKMSGLSYFSQMFK